MRWDSWHSFTETLRTTLQQTDVSAFNGNMASLDPHGVAWTFDMRGTVIPENIWFHRTKYYRDHVLSSELSGAPPVDYSVEPITIGLVVHWPQFLRGAMRQSFSPFVVSINHLLAFCVPLINEYDYLLAQYYDDVIDLPGHIVDAHLNLLFKNPSFIKILREFTELMWTRAVWSFQHNKLFFYRQTPDSPSFLARKDIDVLLTHWMNSASMHEGDDIPFKKKCLLFSKHWTIPEQEIRYLLACANPADGYTPITPDQGLINWPALQALRPHRAKDPNTYLSHISTPTNTLFLLNGLNITSAEKRHIDAMRREHLFPQLKASPVTVLFLSRYADTSISKISVTGKGHFVTVPYQISIDSPLVHHGDHLEYEGRTYWSVDAVSRHPEAVDFYEWLQGFKV